jgi:hypothetical protein
MEVEDECEVIDARESALGYFQVSWDYPNYGKLYSFTYRKEENSNKCLYWLLNRSFSTKYTKKEIDTINQSREKCVFELAKMIGCEDIRTMGDKSDIIAFDPIDTATKDDRKAFWLSVVLLHPSKDFKKLAKLQLKELE